MDQRSRLCGVAWSQFIKDNYYIVRNYAHQSHRFETLYALYKEDLGLVTQTGGGDSEGLVIKIEGKSGCAPRTSGEASLPCTCLSGSAMYDIAKRVNLYGRKQTAGSIDSPAPGGGVIPDVIPNAMDLSVNNPCYLFKLLKEHFGRAPPRQWDGGSASHLFRPKKDTIAKNMLSTNDIREVLDQYEKVYPNFISYGAVPADFCSLDYTVGICRVSLRDMIRTKKECASVVINTDTSNGRGGHWIALWIDIRQRRTPTILFWDSLGDPPPPLIQKAMDRLYAEAKELYREKLLSFPPRKFVPVNTANPH